jgi:hypothetical protein
MNLIISYLLIGVYLVSSCDNLARLMPSHVETIFTLERDNILDIIVNSTLFFLKRLACYVE